MRPNLKVIIERDDSAEVAGSVDTANFFFTTVGNTEEEIIQNIRSQIADYIINEGASDSDWQNVNAADITFDIEYDLTAFFTVFSAIKINSVAELAGINKGLMRQYASGVKTASAQQAAKIEAAVRKLGEKLMHASVVSVA